MTSYTKLFSSLLTSTIWAESDQTRIVWVTMLAMADQHGEVHSTVPGLARIAGVPLSEVEIALAKFTGPDHYSRTKDNDGRRIAEIDGGWELLNHAKYRAMASREDSKAQAADRQRRKRERDESRSVTPCHAPSRSVTQSLHIAEAEAEAEAKEQVEVTSMGDLASEVSKVDHKQSVLEPLRLRICKMMGRRPTTKWSDRELAKLKEVHRSGTAEHDLEMLETYYQSECQFLRRDVLTLLNNWNGEIDRAIAHKLRPPQHNNRFGTSTGPEEGF